MNGHGVTAEDFARSRASAWAETGFEDIGRRGQTAWIPGRCNSQGLRSGQDPRAHVKLSGDINGRYVVTDRRASGELTLVPDTSAEAIRERAGLLDPTPEQAEAFWRDNEPHMLPADDEP
jgi:hypothetical protein